MIKSPTRWITASHSLVFQPVHHTAATGVLSSVSLHASGSYFAGELVIVFTEIKAGSGGRNSEYVCL